MLEAEFNELNMYTLRASKAIADYYDRLETLTDKDKLYIIEKVLAEVDIILAWTMNIRHQVLQQVNTAPATLKIQMNQSLNELKTTMETAKTISFNFTAIYHGIRDHVKGAIE